MHDRGRAQMYGALHAPGIDPLPRPHVPRQQGLQSRLPRWTTRHHQHPSAPRRIKCWAPLSVGDHRLRRSHFEFGSPAASAIRDWERDENHTPGNHKVWSWSHLCCGLRHTPGQFPHEHLRPRHSSGTSRPQVVDSIGALDGSCQAAATGNIRSPASSSTKLARK